MAVQVGLHPVTTLKWARTPGNISREYALRAKYGITLNQYMDLLAQQGFKCAICEVPTTELTREMSVDHCHESDKVRGLLCTNCNAGIGNLKESPAIFMRALAYLKKGKAL